MFLELSLDEMWEEGCYYTQFDVGGRGHYVVIKPEDKDAFLDAFAAEWRKRAERYLVETDEAW